MAGEKPEPPSWSWAVFAFFEIWALAFAFMAVEKFAADKPAKVWGGYALVSLVLFIAGIAWPRIQQALSDHVVGFIEWLASYRVLLVVAASAYVALTKQDPQYRYGALGAATAYALLNVIAYVRALRRDLDRYAMPRRLTARQTRRLRAALNSDRRAITVHVDPNDNEAHQYAGQLFGVFMAAEWNTVLNTTAPYPNADGLRVLITGVGNYPSAAHIEPTQLLQRAFNAAQVRIESAGSYHNVGDVLVTLQVGRRPLAVSGEASLLTRLLHALARAIVRLARRI